MEVDDQVQVGKDEPAHAVTYDQLKATVCDMVANPRARNRPTSSLTTNHIHTNMTNMMDTAGGEAYDQFERVLGVLGV